MNSFYLQYAECDTQIKFIPMWLDKLPVDIASWMSTNILLQSGDGSNTPDTRHETEILQPQEDPKLTTAHQVSLVIHWHNLTMDDRTSDPFWRKLCLLLFLNNVEWQEPIITWC